MNDVILALLAILAGAGFCFYGFLAFRLIIPLWGAFIGFAVGAGLVAGLANDGFLATATGWIVGLVGALAFGLVAYLFYEAAVVIAMASIGFSLGATLMVALDVKWTWVVILVGVAVGAMLAFVAIVTDLPTVLLIVLSALGGASAITTGIMLLTGALDSSDLTTDDVVARADNDWWWYAIYGFLALAGVIIQARGADRLRGTMREAWSAEAPVA